MSKTALLFEPLELGKIKLKNRIVMAPMTRSRATEGLANGMMLEYYSLRASAGLIITEGISPSVNGLGYARIPGLFNEQQANSWKPITDSVHKKGGRIFIQLMHTGRVSHPLNMPTGSKIVAPSAIQLSGKTWTDQSSQQDYPVPKAMTTAEIREAVQEYVKSAELAIQAGFDGVEIHGANGYLVEQFLNPKPNQRTDEYGGSAENRMRFALEVAEGMAKKIGGERVGIRLSPYGVFNDTGAFEGVDQFYGDLAKKLSNIGLVYIHVVDHSSMGAPTVSPEVKELIRKNFQGKYILSGGYDVKRAEKDLEEKKGDLVAVGRPFISNPNLVELWKEDKAMKESDPSTYYTPGPLGYTQI